MTGVYCAGFVGVDELAVHSYRLKQTLEFGVDEVFLEFLYRLVNLCCELRVVDDLAYARAHIDENHDDAVALHLHVRFELGRQEARSSEEALCILKHLECALCPMLVACGECILRHCYCCECLREYITALAQGLSFGCHREIHVALLVEAMLLDELKCRLGCVEPLLVLLDIVVCKGANECEAALKPYRLGCIHQRSVAIYASIDTAINPVPTVLHPERHDVLGQILLVRFCPRLNIFFYVHFFYNLKLVGTLKETYLLKLLLHLSLFLISHVAERYTVWSEVETEELHDALAANDVAAEVADDVDYGL